MLEITNKLEEAVDFKRDEKLENPYSTLRTTMYTHPIVVSVWTLRLKNKYLLSRPYLFDWLRIDKYA